MVEEWRRDYNLARPPSSLGYLAPETFRHSTNSHYPWHNFRGKVRAGKTTTIKVLATLLIPTSGRATVMGLDAVKDAKSLRSKIGFLLGGERGLYYRLSGRENLRYFAVLYKLEPRYARSRVEELLELVGLRDRADERVAGFSRGMKQRLHIARMLLHDPRILILDEPTMGLDPVGARELRDLLHRLHTEEKRTVLLTTHYMFEADALCQRIAILDQGKVVAQGTPESLKDLVSDLSVVELEVFGAGPEHLDRLREVDVRRNIRRELRERT